MINKKFLVILLITLFIFLTGLSCQKKETTMMENMPFENKKVVLVVAFNDYQDIEFNQTKKALEDEGVQITVASLKKGEAKGVLGGKILIDKTLEEIDLNEYDGLVFIGGPGTTQYFENDKALSLAKEAVEKNKVLGAICIAPVILAKAGVLSNKKATVWSSFIDKSFIEEIKKENAIYLDQDVVVDGKIVTANGPSSAKKFGQTIAELLK
jgi:protease I